jgi:type III restriction enzyme
VADIACQRITAGITQHFLEERPIKAMLDPYNPTGSTMHVRFNTSRVERWTTDPERCHINLVIYDSDWEAEFCRVAEAHPRVVAYVKNHGLGFEVPYRHGAEVHHYRPDFIVLIDDGRPARPDGKPDFLQLVVEIKGYRGENAKEKKLTMDTYWVPGVNNLFAYGRWAFAEFTEMYTMESDFKERFQNQFNEMVDAAVNPRETVAAI